MSNHWIGERALGDQLDFIFTTRGEDGLDVWGGDAPEDYDVFDSVGGLIATGLIDEIGGTDSDVFAPQQSTLYTIIEGDFPEGSIGTVVVNNFSGSDDRRMTFSFRISKELEISTSTRKIDLDEVTDGAAQGSLVDNTLFGRLMTLERNQLEVIFPRLKRILGLCGEHQLVDAYLYDDDGNITECRVRIFDTKSNRDGASIWDDRLNENDPAPALETGEIARYIDSISNRLPRNLRTVYQQAINTDQPDNDFTASVM